MATVRIPEETLHRLEAVARTLGSDVDTLASEALAAYVEDEAAFVDAVHQGKDAVERGEVVPDEELDPAAGYPHDWTDYLRYRFEEGRKAIARGEYFDGPPAELMARMGEPWFSTQRPDGRKGSGLGLAIARQVAALHEGSLRFEPAEPGLRVLFTFRSHSP